jgi:two-component system, NarL family, nitrate/nitrite response regulator NarL
MSDLLRVAVVDDHPLFREGVVNALMSAGDIEVVGEGATATDALKIAQERLPDVILLDIQIAGGGIEAASYLARSHPNLRIIILTALEDEEHVSSALKAGAQGYLSKATSGEALVQVVRGIARGDRYVAPALAARLLRNKSNKIDAFADYNLTPREEQILAFVARGMSNKEIARACDCNEATVRHHVTNIIQKLHVRNRTQAALKFEREWNKSAN